MKFVVLLFASATLIAQDQGEPLRTTARLVVAPVSVTDQAGKHVEPLSNLDLMVYDNDTMVRAHVEDLLRPLSMVVVVQATASAQSSLDKLRKEVSLFGPLLIGQEGEAAVIAFAHEVRVLQEFTRSTAKVEKTIGELDAFGEGGRIVDALAKSLQMLGRRGADRRRAILLISERHDRGSIEGLEAVVRTAERVNATIYALTFSPFRSKFFNAAPKHCNPERACRRCTCGNCAMHCDRERPADVPSNVYSSGGLLSIFGELKRKMQPDVPKAFTELSGGQMWGFEKRTGLSAALQRIGEDLHHHYIVTFPMGKAEPGSFHRIRVAVRGRPELVARTRSGYYELADE